MVKKIVSAILSLAFITPLFNVKLTQESKPKKIDSIEILNLKDYKLKQVEDKLKVEIEKLKEIEAKKLEEEKQRELKQQRQPHFNPYNVTEPSNLSKEQIHKMLEGTELITLVDALYWYEQEYGVNAIFITSIVALESGWGTSNVGREYNNLTGYKSKNGGYYYFNNWGESVQETFRLIAEEYTSEDGLFYNGKSVWNINVRYCELDSWSNKIINIGNHLLHKTIN